MYEENEIIILIINNHFFSMFICHIKIIKIFEIKKLVKAFLLFAKNPLMFKRLLSFLRPSASSSLVPPSPLFPFLFKSIKPNSPSTSPSSSSLPPSSPLPRSSRSPSFSLLTSSSSLEPSISSLQPSSSTLPLSSAFPPPTPLNSSLLSAKRQQLSFNLNNFPPFEELNDEHLVEFTQYSFNLQLKSPFRWTPLLQIKQADPEFLFNLRKFSKIRGWKDDDTSSLISLMLSGALKNTNFDFFENYPALPSGSAPFHGNLSFLLWNKGHPCGLPIVPVVKVRSSYNKLSNQKLDDWNLASCVGAGIWALSNMLAVDETVKEARVLETNGNSWVMYEFGRDGEFKKTGMYEGNNQFKKIYLDKEMVQVVMGLIQFSVGAFNESESELIKIYEYLDDLKFFDKVDANSKESVKILDKKEKAKFLPNFIRNVFK